VLCFYNILCQKPDRSEKLFLQDRRTVIKTNKWSQAGARKGRVWGSDAPSKICSWGKKLHMALMSGSCQSNDNDHLSKNQRVMLHDKTWFYDFDRRLEKWFSLPCSHIATAKLHVISMNVVRATVCNWVLRTIGYVSSCDLLFDGDETGNLSRTHTHTHTQSNWRDCDWQDAQCWQPCLLTS